MQRERCLAVCQAAWQAASPNVPTKTEPSRLRLLGSIPALARDQGLSSGRTSNSEISR